MFENCKICRTCKYLIRGMRFLHGTCIKEFEKEHDPIKSTVKVYTDICKEWSKK